MAPTTSSVRTGGWLSHILSGASCGDFCADGTRTFGQIPFELRGHLGRFYRNADLLSMKLHIGRHRLERQILAVLGGLQDQSSRPMEDFAIRIAAVREGDRIHSACRVAFTVETRDGKLPQLHRYASEGVALSLVDQPAVPRSIMRPQIKSQGSAHFRVAEVQAERKLAGSWALMRSTRGQITEGVGIGTSGWNIFLLRGDKLETPSARDVVNGFARRAILSRGRELGLRTVERRLTVEDVHQADLVFVTSSMIGAVPVRSFDGHLKPIHACRETFQALLSAFYMPTERTAKLASPPSLDLRAQ